MLLKVIGKNLSDHTPKRFNFRIKKNKAYILPKIKNDA